MIVEEALVAQLVNTAGVMALIGTRVYPVQVPQGVPLPAVSYQRISGAREHSQSGSSALAHPRFQLTVTGQTYNAVRAASNAIRAAVDGWSGTLGGAGGIDADVFVENEIDGYASESGQAGVYVVRLDLIIWHAE